MTCRKGARIHHSARGSQRRASQTQIALMNKTTNGITKAQKALPSMRCVSVIFPL